MRVIRQYRFEIGTKIPFADWPGIVHRFLEENGLTYGRFMYYFDYPVINGKRPPKPFQRLLKYCPSLGETRYWDWHALGMLETAWLSNIDQEAGFPEEHLLPLMPKIQCSYGFADSSLYYFDIDFFGRVTPFERDYTYAQDFSRTRECPYDPTAYIEQQPRGSGIMLNKDGAFGKHCLILTIDVLRDGQVLDASPYCEAMQRLLPEVKVRSQQTIVLSEMEKQQIAETNRLAEPVLERCKAFFRERLQSVNEKDCTDGRYSVAKAMKKIAQEHGYIYQYKPELAVYVLERRTSRGFVLQLKADGGPRDYSANLSIDLKGIGFTHHLGRVCCDPADQAELEADYAAVMEVIDEFERTLLPRLDACFPETPAWFEPNVFF